MMRRHLARAAGVALAMAMGAAFGACIPGFATREEILGTGGGGTSTASTGGSSHASSSASSTTSASSSSTASSNGTGGAASCSDGIQNEGESDVDCGGPCPGCALGKRCTTVTDCAFATGTPTDAGGGSGGGSAAGPAARCVEGVCVPPATGAWVTVPLGGTGPGYREETALTYDALDQQSVLYGGLNGSGSGQQAWGWNGTTWVGLGSVVAPDPGTRLAPVLAYDAARGRTMLFGGWVHGVNPTYLNDALEWDGQVWTPLSPAQPPSGRGNAAFAFDVNDQLVIFGGLGATNELGDTWLWDTSTDVFTPVTYGASPHPTNRAAAAAAFDEEHGVVVLFGGRAAGVVNAETWTWDGASWLEASPATSPSARSDANMVYDGWRKRIVLFGGHDAGYPASSSMTDSWDWDGTTWTPITTSSPPPLSRNGPGVAFDEGRGRMVLFGGDVSLNQDTHVYELTVWSNACTTDADCETGFCTDGLCCRMASCNTCEACNVDPVQAGDCAQVPTGTADPRCDGGTCNGMGLCGP